jgi:hypothetical protein
MWNPLSKRLLPLMAAAYLLALGGLSGCGLSQPQAGAAVSPPSWRLTAYTCAAVRVFAPTQSPGQQGHQTFQRVVLGPLPSQRTWRPRSSMHFTWCAVPGSYTTAAVANPERLSAQLVGPFHTKAAGIAAEQALVFSPSTSMPSAAPNITTITAPSLQTTTWEGADVSVTLALPNTAAPGYYVFRVTDDVVSLAGEGDVGSLAGGGNLGGIVQVVSA